MAETFKFYEDAAGTTEVGLGLFRVFPGINKPLYFLSTDAAKRAQANSDPGIDSIVFSILDTTPGTDLADTNIKIALSEGALAAAPFGGTASPGVTVLGGVANGVAVWIGNDSTEGVGVSITTNELLEDVI